MKPTSDRDYFFMATNTEQRQAIWYVTGLAEVLSDPGSQDQSDDAIVQFDRYRRTRTPSPQNVSANTLSHAARRRLDQWGYVLVEDIESSTAAEELVRSMGDLIDGRSYSHGSKTISAHTEAPGWHCSATATASVAAAQGISTCSTCGNWSVHSMPKSWP